MLETSPSPCASQANAVNKKKSLQLTASNNLVASVLLASNYFILWIAIKFMVGKRLLLTAKLAFLIFSFTVFPNMSTARSNTNEYSQIKLPAETKKHLWPFCTEDRKPTPQMCHWQSLLGAETSPLAPVAGRKQSMDCPTGVAKGAKTSKPVYVTQL